MFTELDTKTWPRKATHDFFRDYADPFFNFTASVDVTRLCAFCKQNDLAFSLAALYYTLVAANEIREFRIRLMQRRLVEFDRIHATQTILNDDDTFSFSYYEMKDNVFDFVSAGRAAVEKYKALKTFDVEADRLDLIYYSVIPWVSFTSFKHASRLDRDLTIPKIVFGKIFGDENVKKIPLSVEANHAIMDGIHVGRFFNRFQELIDNV